MKDCVFCKIAKGEIPCYKIFEDEEFMAFLDITPVNSGHTLIIPKKHYESLIDMSEDSLKKILFAAKKIMIALEKEGIGQGYNLLQNNKSAAGQDVFHAHFHIIPRIEGDKSLTLKWIEKPSEKEFKEILEKIKGAMK